MPELAAAIVIIASNLRRFRNARGMSQIEVARKAGLSRNTYVSLEAGKAEPRSSTLMQVSAALGVRLEELLVEPGHLRAVRFRAHKKMVTRDGVLHDVGRWLSDYVELEELLDERPTFPFKEINKGIPKSGDSLARARKIAADARACLNLQPSEPIRDICGLLEDKGIKLFTTEVKADGFFGLSVGIADGGPAVAVNVEERIPVERQIFTAAHELGHLVMHLDAFDPTNTEENDDEEKEANVFAGHFLMPQDVFEKEWHEASGLPFVKRVLKIKRIFHVSYKTVLYRVSEQSEGGPAVWQRFQKEYRATYRKPLGFKEEPDALAGDMFNYGAPARIEPMKLEPADFFADRMGRLIRKALEKELISRSRGAEILGVSVSALREMVESWHAAPTL